jgi:hypothetical protein
MAHLWNNPWERKEARVWESGQIQEHEIMDYSFKV